MVYTLQETSMFLNNHWKKWFKWFRVFLRTIQFNFIQNDGSHSIQFNSQQFNFTTSFVFIELWFVQTSSQSLSSTAPSNTKKFIMTSCWRGWWLLIAPVMVELHVFWIIYGPGKMPFNQNGWWQSSRCCGNCKGSTLGRKEGRQDAENLYFTCHVCCFTRCFKKILL